MGKKDFGKQWNRGCSNGRIFIIEIDDEAPKRPIQNDILIYKDSPYKQFIKKAASETRTSTTTMQDDNDITFTLAKNGTYEIKCYFAASGSSVGNIKTEWSVSGGASQKSTRHCQGPGVSTTDSRDGTSRNTKHNLGTDVSYGIDGSRTSAIYETFLIETSGSDGTIQLRWAQNTSDASSTTLSTNSYAICTQIENNDTSKIKIYDDGSWVSVLS